MKKLYKNESEMVIEKPITAESIAAENENRENAIEEQRKKKLEEFEKIMSYIEWQIRQLLAVNRDTNYPEDDLDLIISVMHELHVIENNIDEHNSNLVFWNNQEAHKDYFERKKSQLEIVS